MSELTFDAFQKRNLRRCNEAFPRQCGDWSPSIWALALAGEVGELCNVLKKIERGDFTLAEKRTEIPKELADVITYCDLLTSRLNAKTSEILMAKFDEVSARVGWAG